MLSYRVVRQHFYYTKYHLKYGKNQADNLAAVENSELLETTLYWDFGADFFLYFIGVQYYIFDCNTNEPQYDKHTKAHIPTLMQPMLGSYKNELQYACKVAGQCV